MLVPSSTQLPKLELRDCMKLRKSAHTQFTGHSKYHIAGITRVRRKILIKVVRQYMETKFREVWKYYPEWEYIAIGIVVDHVHLYMMIPLHYCPVKSLIT